MIQMTKETIVLCPLEYLYELDGKVLFAACAVCATALDSSRRPMQSLSIQKVTLSGNNWVGKPPLQISRSV